MKAQIPLFLIIMMLFSCNSSSNNQTSSDTSITQAITNNATEETDLINTKLIDKSPKQFRGLYTLGNEVNTFRDCNDLTKVYWVNDSLSSLKKSYEKATSFLSYPYESVYAEVNGYLAGKSNLGYASEYENVLVITGIQKIEGKNFNTDCYPYEFIALGNEPFWSVDIIPVENRIILKYAGMEKVYEFPYKPATLSGNIYRFETINSKNEKLILIIKKEKCSDGMSDRQYNYSAEVHLNGEILKGCAIKKGDIKLD